MSFDSGWGIAVYFLGLSLFCGAFSEIYRLKKRIRRLEDTATFEGGKLSTQLQSLKGTYCWLTIYNENNEFSYSKKYYCYIIDCDDSFVHITWLQNKYTNRSMIRISDIARIDFTPQ